MNVIKNTLSKLTKLKNSALYVLLIAVFIGVNALLAPIALRWDLSYGKAYTLSSSTKKILHGLNDVVTIQFFASSDLPTRLLPLKNQVVDTLDEYKKENKGKMTIKILDPKSDQNAANSVKDLGIPQLQFSQLEQDKYAVTSSYFGISIAYGDKKDILPQVTDIGSLEYNLTASIYKLTRKENVKIAVIGRSESFDPQNDELMSFDKVMRQQFDLSFIDVSSQSATKEIDPSYKTIMVFDDNKKEFGQDELDALKKYIDNNGKAIFFVDGVWVQPDLTTTPAKHNLFTLLNNYGITVNQNLILSTSAELVNFGNNTVSFMSPYPFWLKTNVFNQKSSYFTNVNQLTFPWASSLTVKNSGNELIKTTPRSWEQKDNYVLDPQNLPQPTAKDLKGFIVGAETQINNGGRILVIPSSRFILERYLTTTSDNLQLISNVVSDYASNGALSGIRQRSVSFYPLPDLTDNQKNIFKYANILTLPLLFGIIGALWLMRRK